MNLIRTPLMINQPTENTKQYISLNKYTVVVGVKLVTKKLSSVFRTVTRSVRHKLLGCTAK